MADVATKLDAVVATAGPSQAVMKHTPK